MSETAKRRGRGEGSVFLPKHSKCWWASFYTNGKRHRFNTRELTRKGALTVLRDRTVDAAQGRMTPRSDRVTFGDLAEGLISYYVGMYVRKRGYRPSEQPEPAPLKRVRLALDHLAGMFDGWKAVAISPAVVEKYRERRGAEGAAAATIYYETAMLKKAFSRAVELGQLTQSPILKNPEVQNARSGFFERADFEAVRAALPDYIRPVITTSYLTGWRISEVLGLTWNRVDFAAGEIRLDPGTTKNRKGRVFPFAGLEELEAVLTAQRDAVSELEKEGSRVIAHVFTRRGAPICGFRKAWKAACAATGLQGRIVHDFRRTAVRNLVRSGVSEKVAMELTGHLTRSVFDRYNITSKADLTAAVGKLATYHGQPAGRRDVLPMRRTGTADR